MKNRHGFTLIEVLLSLSGLLVILLALYFLFVGGMKSWQDITPQIDVRKKATETFYGKRGNESSPGIVGELQQAVWLRPTTFGSLTLFGDQRLYLIKSNTYTTTPNPNNDEIITYFFSQTGLFGSITASNSLFRLTLHQQGTETIINSATLLSDHLRVGTFTAFDSTTGTQTILESKLFTYYDDFGKIIPDPVANAADIQQVEVNLAFDIDNDRDGRYGEDGPGDVDGDDRDNDDDDSRIDEDPPIDFRLTKTIYCPSLH